MDFDVDVFLSYAHIDDESVAEGEPGWISILHRSLEVRLAQVLGEKAKIWRDPKLAGNDVFDEKLLDRLHRTALLVSIFSPRYLRSEWCRRELDTFLEAAQGTGGVHVDNRFRVFKVVKTPVPLHDHPEGLQSALGYQFYSLDPETNRPREFNQSSGKSSNDLFLARLDDLAYDMAELLEKLRGRSAAADAKGSVYLATTTQDLASERDIIKRELQGQGYQVLPSRQLPLTKAECDEFVRDQLEECRWSIHMIGASRAFIPEGTTASVAEVESGLAIERGEQGSFSRLIWMPNELDATDENQQTFIDTVQTDTRIQQGAELLQCSIGDLKTAMGSFLRKEETPVEVVAPSPTLDHLQVYLICDKRDVDDAKAVADYLRGEGFDVVLPAFSGDEAEVRLDHEETLVFCDAVLIYWGAANALWLRRMSRELLKAPGYGRTKTMLAQSAYIAGPMTDEKDEFRSPQLPKILGGEGFTPSQLASFVDCIRQAAGG